MPRSTLPCQPDPVDGAAYYWADGNKIIMRDNQGYISCIDSKSKPGAALDCAKAWQIKENKAVTKEAKRVASKS